VCKCEHNYLGFYVTYGNGHEERAERVLGSRVSRGQKGNGVAANGPIRTASKISAESEAQSTPEVQQKCPPPAILIDFAGVLTIDEKFARQVTIYSQGSKVETIMYIKRGRVKLSVASKTGKEAVVAILGPGDFLGEGCLAGQHIRMGTATAIVPTALQVIEKNEMIRALRADHAFSERFLSYMLSRNIRMEEDLVDQLCQCSERRLARALLQLAGKWDPRRVRRFAGISQTTLAKMIGTTRSRVNFFMNKFRRLGFIKYDGALSESAGIRVNTSLLAKAFCN